MIVGPLAALAPAAALWLTARVGRDGAAVVWAAGLALWIAGTGPFLLLALAVAMEVAAAAAGWLGSGRTTTRRPDPVAGVIAGLAPAVALALARPLGSFPLLWDAALVGALAARAAGDSGTLAGRPPGQRAVALPSLRPAPAGTPGAVSGAGLAAAAAAAALVAALATALGLLAAGDAALVAGAAVVASLAGGALAGRASGPVRDLLAGVVAAALAAGLVVALP